MKVSIWRFGGIVSIAVIILFLLVEFHSTVAAESFVESQRQYPRVRTARKNAGEKNINLLTKSGIDTNSFRIFIQAFKLEKELELWASDCDTCPHKLIKTYPFASSCGILGPKRAQGDMQIPEGFYFINRFNPKSKFHLSLGIDYPNRSDRIRTRADNPGGDIFIHGNRVTIGCIPLGDAAIEELYLFAVDSRNSGQDKIRVFIFPCRFDDASNKETLQKYRSRSENVSRLWDELKSGYDYFKKTDIPPKFKIDSTGAYRVLGADWR